MQTWEHADWPHFRWQDSRLLEKVAATRLKQGRLLGSLTRLEPQVRAETRLAVLIEEALASFEIDGYSLDRRAVQVAVRGRLGAIGLAESLSSDRVGEGIVGMILDATANHGEPLGAARLFAWQAALFPSGYSRQRKVTIGAWRSDTNGPKLFADTPVELLDGEMQRFFAWFERRTEPEGLLRAGLALLWFALLRPFDGGNGRIARAIADMALAQSEGSGQRFYSLSSQIREERTEYLLQLERARSGGLDVTEWLVWFVDCLARALDRALDSGAPILRQADFWQHHARKPLSERQKAMLDRYLGDGTVAPTTRSWAALAQCSIPTAQRDINDLVARNVLRRNPGGSKNTSYSLAAG